MGVPGFSEKSSSKMETKGVGEEENVVWRLASICLFQCIWRECNQRTFEDEELLDQSLKDLFIWLLLEWSQQFLGLESPSILNFLDALYCG